MRKVMLLLLLLPLSLLGQITLNEGKLFYDISYQNLSAEMKRNEHLLPHEASFYFKNHLTRMEMGIGGMGKNTTLFNRNTKETTILLNIMGKRFAMTKNDSEMTAFRNTMLLDSISQTVRVEVMQEFKTIAGMKCQKALVHKTKGETTQLNECWFTNEIPPFNTENDPNLKDISGFLMQYNITENGMVMTMTVKMVMPVPLEDSLFKIPEGYQLVTEAELKKILMVMQSNPSGH